jgi:hypothetical protein
MKRCFAFGRILFVFALVTCGMSGFLCEANADADSGKIRILMMASKAETKASTAQIRAVRAQLSDLGIDFQVAWTQTNSSDLHVQAEISEQLAKEYNATMVFWSDLLIGERVFLYVSEPGGGRILVRSISFEDKNQADRFEVIAVIVRSVAEAIAGGGHIGVSSQVSASPAASGLLAHPSPVIDPQIPAASQSQPSRPAESADAPHRRNTADVDAHQNSSANSAAPARIELAAAYGLTLYSSTQRFIHGVRAALAVRVNRWGRLFWAYRVQIPFEVKNDLVTMKLRHHPFEIGFSRRFELGSLYLDLGAAVINDPLTWQVKPADTSRVAAAGDRFRWLVGVTPFVQLSWLPLRVFKLYLAIAADIYFNESRSFVERTNGDKAAVVDPFKARPQLQLGAVFFLF